MRNIPSDQEILAAVNEEARLIVNANIDNPKGSLPKGFRCDMSRVGSIRRAFEAATKKHLEETGLDVREALREHEANLRSRHYAPQLYVERRR